MTETYTPQKGTLVYELITVDNLPSYADSVNKKATKEEIFRQWSHSNELVKRVLEEQTTFTQEFDNLVGQYSHGALWRGYIPPDNIKNQVYDLEGCLGKIVGSWEETFKGSTDRSPLSEDSITSVTSNPLVTGLGLGGFTAGTSYLVAGRGKEPLFNRRGIIICGLPGLLIGGSIGTGESLEYQVKLNHFEEGAKYLDEQYQLVYHNIQPQVKPSEEKTASWKIATTAIGISTAVVGAFYLGLKRIKNPYPRSVQKEKTEK